MPGSTCKRKRRCMRPKPTSSWSGNCGRAAWPRPRIPPRTSARCGFTLKLRNGTRRYRSASPSPRTAPALAPALGPATARNRAARTGIRRSVRLLPQVRRGHRPRSRPFPPGRRWESRERSLMTGNRPAADARHVVVVGAGFAGLSTVKGLTKAGYRVTLMDRNLYSTFQPLLYQVATGGINPGDVSYVVGGFTRKYGARYCRGELPTIDPAARRIGLADGREISYDYLIIATGVSASHYGIKGAEQYTYGLYTR